MQSMTGFAAREGRDETLTWRWELRSVNGRGLDVRYRGPDGREGVEAKFRAAAAARLGRGSVNASLRLTRAPGAPRVRLDHAALTAAIDLAAEAARAVQAAGLP
ncbi:MAG: YicC/YloC family endoribonuclease, partial [Pseudomonadota bacterium]